MSQKNQPLVMVFSGQGPQNLAMGRALFAQVPIFRDTLRLLDDQYKASTGFSLIDDIGMFGSKVGSEEDLNQAHYTVISLSFMQLALFELLKHYGVTPDIVVGHSVGEMPMLYASGQVGLLESAKIAIARSEAFRNLPQMGGMIAVAAKAGDVQALLKDIPECNIAAFNSPQSCTLSGTFAGLKTFEERVAAAKLKWTLHRLNVKHAYHSPLMKPIKDFYLGEAQQILSAKPPMSSPIKVMSTVTGKWYTELFTPEYCWSNVIQPVLFEQAITGILADYPEAIFIEIAPHPVLSNALQECGVEHMVSLMHKLKPEISYLLENLQVIEKLTREPLPKLQEFKDSLGFAAAKPRAHQLAKQDIAIIGISCRFPGGIKNKNDYWQFLKEGKSGIQTVPADRWDAEAFYFPQNVAGKIINKVGGFLEEVFDFDYSEFGISYAEARAMDPSQRVLLEVAYEVLEDANMPFHGTRTGVFVGGQPNDHVIMMATEPEYATPYNISGAENGVTANRVSFTFDLKGPSLLVDTACASSLTALHLAVNSIYAGECDQAMVAGINLLLEPFSHVCFSRLGVLSPTGQCHVFDAKADGYVRSEGCAAVIIKPLEAALRDGNNIYAVIKATNISSNGSNKSITMPSFDAQYNLFADLLARAHVQPDQIDYAELHGTGTPVGDPIEVNGIGEILCQQRSFTKPLGIGSGKSSLGHMEHASGMGGLIKVALMLKNRCLVPTIGFDTPNPNIHWDQYALKVVTAVEPLPTDKPIHMTVSAYGFAGANAMALLTTCESAQESVKNQTIAQTEAEDTLFVVGGLNRMGTERLAHAWQKKEIDPKLAGTVMLKRAKPMEWHSYAVGNQLQNLEFSKPKYTPSSLRRPLIYVIAGDGGFHPLLGHQLYQRFAVFRNTIHELDKLLVNLLSKEVLRELTSSSLLEMGYFRDGKLNHEPGLIEKLIAIFFFHIATIDLLTSLGFAPDVVHGSSLGEYTASYVAGELSKHDVVVLLHYMVKNYEDVPFKTKGDLLGIFAAPGEKNIFADTALHKVQELMAGIPDLYIAIDNDPTTVTVSGTELALEEISKRCTQENIKFSKIGLGVAAHSPLSSEISIEEAKLTLGKLMSNMQINPPKIPIISSYTGMVRTEPLSAEYLIKMFYGTTRIRQSAISFIKEFPNAIVVEIAPTSQMMISAMRCGLTQPLVVASEEHELQTFLTVLGELALLNRWVNSQQLNGIQYANNDIAPAYPFDKKFCSLETAEKKLDRLRHKQLAFAGKNFFVSTTVFPWLADHQVDGRVIFPGTAYIEIAMQHGFKSIKNLYIHKPWIVSNEIQQAQFVQQGLQWSVQMGRIEYASGEGVSVAATPKSLHLDELRAHITENISVAEHYRNCSELSSIVYGPSFQRIVDIKRNANEILATVSWEANDYVDYILPPPVIDSALQSSMSLVPYPLVFLGIERVNYYQPLPKMLYVYSKMIKLTPKQASFNVFIADEKGNICVSLEGAMAARYTPSKPAPPEYYTVHQVPVVLPTTASLTVKPHLFYYTGDPQALVDICCAQDQGSPFALWVICDDTPESAAVLGLGRCIINEYPNWQVKLLRIPHTFTAEQREIALKELQAVEWSVLPQELYLQADGWYCPALENATQKLAEKNSSSYFVDMAEGFGLDGLRVSSKPRRSLNPDEVRIDVQATGVNFKDALIAMGSIQLADSFLGLEVAGVITELGTEARGFSLGDKVYALSTEPGFSNEIIVPQDFVGHIPEALSFAEAASIAVVYTTCWYALVHLAHIKAGDKVLIHSGGGSVGQAAIQICLAHGCKIMVTVHGEEKQAYLKQAYGNTLQFADSHDITDWSTKVREWSPEGVQCVVNSLANEALVEGLRCLADEGRFIELGKRDFLEHSLLDMQHLYRNIKFYSVHLDLLIKTNQAIFAYLFQEVAKFIRSEHYKPILNHVYPFTEVKTALSTVLNSQHVGKLVVSDYPAQALTQGCSPLLHPEKYYVLLGGCGALGMELLPWLIQEGARHVVLTSRHAAIDAKQQYLLDWARSIGIEVLVKSVDSTDKTQMQTLFSSLPLPLGGIILLSAVFDDKPINKLDAESFAKVCEPKVTAAKIIMELVNPDTIEFVLLFSSVASLLGNPGQGNYALANGYFDELAQAIPYVRVVNLPGIMDAGQLKQHPEVLRKIEAFGIKTSRSDYIGPLLKHLLLGVDKRIVGMSANWYTLANNLPSSRKWIPDAWLENSVEQPTSGDIDQDLRELLAATFGVAPEIIDDESPLVQYGLDSLNATAIAFKINQKYNADLTQLELLGGMNYLALREKLLAAKEEGGAGKFPPGIVRLNATTQGTPLFVLHDITGKVDVYEQLCARINVPCYGIYKHPSQRTVSSIEEVANLYVDLIQQVQPEGPYRLLGWSAGGMIAWAVAHQLLAQGKAVEQLILLDSIASIGSLILPEQAMKHLEKIDYEALALAYLVKITDEQTSPMALYKTLAPISGLTDRVQYVKEKYPIKLLPADMGNIVQTAAFFSKLMLANKELQLLDCQVTLFSASETQRRNVKLEIPAAKFTQKNIKGNHWTILTSPELFTYFGEFN
jgi:acyl transferase domain-containing protein/NADPH:quinone reductase-like Zn-dependent oxidoreductase/pimeloyl-ACP methyl ester carboxylesterase/acyl carrier protein